MINIICSNSYRSKTLFEELDEILELEPIAKVFYEEERKDKKRGDGGEDFREFFAKKFLGIPPTTLQRTLALRHLVAEAREVYKQVPIPKTTLSELAYKKEEIQREILNQILNGELRGTLQEVKGYKAQDDNAEEENNGENAEIPNNETEDTAPVKEEDKVEDDNADIADNTEANDPVSEVKEDVSGSDDGEIDQNDNNIGDNDNNNGKVADESNEENSENSEDKENDQFDGEEEVPSDDTDEENQEEDISDESTEETEEPQENVESEEKNNSSEPPKIISPDEAREEAEQWVQNGIKRMIEEAENMKKEAEEKGDSKKAAMWDLRRAAANLVLETIK